MCDCLVALPAATAQPFTLFAKNSDRPPDERQVIEWNPPRRDRTTVRTTHIAIDPFDTETIGCLISRPTWCWGAEHGVNEAGVAIAIRAGRHGPRSRVMLDDRPVTVESLTAHLRSHDSYAQPGWSVCMHVDGVEQTTA